jgi:hypothetical protein
MMKCTRHLFLFWVDLARLYRSEWIGATKIIVSLLPSPLLLVFSVIVGQSRVWGFEWQFWILTEFKAKLAFRVFVTVDASFLRPNSHS